MDKNSLGYLVLRIGVVFLFVWFGSMQIANPTQWVGLIPKNVAETTGLAPQTLVLLNGSLEIAGAVLLALNLFVPLVATLLSLHIVSIVFILGFTPIGARDIALAVAVLALAFLSSKKNV